MHAIAGTWKGLGDAITAGLLAGVIFLLFYLAGGMGAGDVKLITAAAAFIGVANLGTFLLTIGLAGGVFAIAASLYRGVLKQAFADAGRVMAHHAAHGLQPHPELNLDRSAGIRLPFAFPIAAACLITLAMELTRA